MKKAAVIMGSKSDLPVVQPAIDCLRSFGVEVEVRILSAHRTPEAVHEFAQGARDRGVGVIIAAAGKAAHLGGVVAAVTTLPVIGLPVKSSFMDGLDSLLSMVQMPTGIPVDHIYVPCSFDLVVKSNLNYLIETHTNRLVHQIQDNKEKLEVLQIIEKLKKTNNWKAIFDLTYDDACSWLQRQFKCSQETSAAVLRKPISYLTKEHQQEIDDLIDVITELENDQSDIFEMLTKKYKAVKQKVLKEIAPNTTKFI